MKQRHFREPIWRDAQWPTSLTPPGALRHWLHDASSLTRRLQRRYGEGFNVELMGESLERPTRSEVAVLGIPSDRLAWIRRVYLRNGKRRLVYARTVMPMETLHGPNAGLTRLGTRPLGGFLFSHPQARRSGLQVARAMVPGEGEAVFGRRSLFRLRNRPLLVSEFFLHDFVKELG